jgi:hypothetical protein
MNAAREKARKPAMFNIGSASTQSSLDEPQPTMLQAGYQAAPKTRVAPAPPEDRAPVSKTPSLYAYGGSSRNEVPANEINGASQTPDGGSSLSEGHLQLRKQLKRPPHATRRRVLRDATKPAFLPPPSVPRYALNTPEVEYDDFRSWGELEQPKEINRGSPMQWPGTESYEHVRDNPFLRVNEHPLSTFSIDVDTASYANVRRFLNQGQRPPRDAVRIEELINYFPYHYEPPRGGDPFAVYLEVGPCLWEPASRLVRVGIKGKEMANYKRPSCNLVFLVDVSGSMQPSNKLPLVKRALRMLVEQMTGTLVTIAKDVKVQIEFNPAHVGAYRLIGYENRVMATRDFHDDRKDAGEVGAGHTVTALYEVVPAPCGSARLAPDEWKCQRVPSPAMPPYTDELLTLKLRYKQPNADTSKLMEFPARDRDVRISEASEDFRFAAAVAEFGMILRDSE